MIPICGSPLATTPRLARPQPGLIYHPNELPVIQIVYFLHLLSKFDAGGAGHGQVSS
jgi:hypothetical protein